MMDPNSRQNMMMRNLLSQNSLQLGAQSANQASEMAAMTGMSGGQAMKAQEIARNQATGGVNEHWLNAIQGQFSQGLGLMGNMTGMQQGLDENIGNAYIGQVNAHNARRNQRAGLGMQVAGGLMKSFGLSDRRLKVNIELVGKSPKGHNIYEFDYKNKNYGPDRYRGVMADEVPFASMKDGYGYEFVNYNHPDLDVKFERIK